MSTSIRDFVRTIYLGDRACKSIVIDGWTASVRVQVDCISRIRSASGEWDFYTAEDIENGELVFSGVRSVVMENGGFVPNDVIGEFSVVGQSPDGVVHVEMSIQSVDEDAVSHETKLRVQCRSVHIDDPRRPNLQIRD